MPSAFVTGATGFLGGHVARRLREGGWDVTCLRRTAPAPTGNADADADAERYVLGDVTDRASLERGLPRGCDAVFHVAADIAHWKAKDARQNEVNIIGTRNLARVALGAGVGRFIHCSSDAVWGLKTPVLREDMPRLGVEEPINYQRSKFWAEEEIRCAMEQGLDAVMVNPTNIVGPGDVQGWSLFPASIHLGHTRAAPPGAGAFTYVEDVADAMIAAAELGRSGHNYLLGGTNATYLAFAQLCAERLGRRFPDTPRSAASVMREARAQEAEAALSGKEPRLSVDTARVLCATLEVDSSKAIRELGFRVRPLEELVDLTLDWLRVAGIIG